MRMSPPVRVCFATSATSSDSRFARDALPVGTSLGSRWSRVRSGRHSRTRSDLVRDRNQIRPLRWDLRKPAWWNGRMAIWRSPFLPARGVCCGAGSKASALRARTVIDEIRPELDHRVVRSVGGVEGVEDRSLVVGEGGRDGLLGAVDRDRRVVQRPYQGAHRPGLLLPLGTATRSPTDNSSTPSPSKKAPAPSRTTRPGVPLSKTDLRGRPMASGPNGRLPGMTPERGQTIQSPSTGCALADCLCGRVVV